MSLRFETPQESEAFEDQRRQEQVKESEVPEEKPSRSTPTEESSEKNGLPGDGEAHGGDAGDPKIYVEERCRWRKE